MLKEIIIDGIEMMIKLDPMSQKVITKPSGKKVIIYDAVVFVDAPTND